MPRLQPAVHVAPLVVLVALNVTAVACRDAQPPLTVQGDRISLVNQTNEEWRDIELRLNGYYVAQSTSLAPGGRLDAPIERFQGGFGRFFDPKRERVREVVVSATTGSGKAVKLTWPDEAPGG